MFALVRLMLYEILAARESDMDQIAQDLSHALSLMRTALSLIDRAEAAYDVAAHLDLAISRLADLVDDLPGVDEITVDDEQKAITH